MIAGDFEWCRYEQTVWQGPTRGCGVIPIEKGKGTPPLVKLSSFTTAILFQRHDSPISNSFTDEMTSHGLTFYLSCGY